MICPQFPTQSRRDKKNLEVLKKLADIGIKKTHKGEVGVEIKINNRLHARFLVAYNPEAPKLRGLLLIGSFDFNVEGTSLERHDAGILTEHPDLVKSARNLFDDIWNDSSPIPLDKAFP